jgi:hypothetical protein
MPNRTANRHRAGYQRWFQSIKRQATSRLIQCHRTEYDDMIAELKQSKPFNPNA